MTAVRSISRLVPRLPALAATGVLAFAVIVVLAVTIVPAWSSAQSITIVHNVGAVVLADSRISMEQAVKMAEQKFKARVVRAQSEDEGGKTIYVLRLLNDSGRVWTVRVDAATGSMI